MPGLLVFTIAKAIFIANDPAMDAPSIFAIDTHYIRPKLAASHLIVANGRGAFVDTGANSSVPHLLAELPRHGLKPIDIDYVLLTHVHLDHAGGAGTLMRSLPNAKCAVHPRGARHMIDPTKLIAASQQVYGDDRFAKLYGELVPIPADRVITIEDGTRLKFGNREFEFIHTAGHANHHYCIVDEAAGIIFAGDTFGVSYRELDTDRGAFIMPITTPSQFDPEAAHQSLDRLLRYRPHAIYVTHYSRLESVAKLAANLHEELDAYVDIARRYLGSPKRLHSITEALWVHTNHRLDDHGVRKDEGFRHSLLDGDIKLNAQGLEVWLHQQAA